MTIVRRRRLTRWTSALSAAGLILVAVAAARITVLTPAGSPVPRAATPVALTDDAGAAPMFTVAGLAPDRPVAGCVRVSYSGPDDAPVWVSATGTDPALAPYVDLTIEEGSGGSSAGCAGFTGREVYHGTLAGLQAAGDHAVEAYVAAAGAHDRTLRFALSVRSDDAAQGASTGVDFTWSTDGVPVGSASPPATTTPAPAPATTTPVVAAPTATTPAPTATTPAPTATTPAPTATTPAPTATTPADTGPAATTPQTTADPSPAPAVGDPGVTPAPVPARSAAPAASAPAVVAATRFGPRRERPARTRHRARPSGPATSHPARRGAPAASSPGAGPSTGRRARHRGLRAVLPALARTLAAAARAAAPVAERGAFPLLLLGMLALFFVLQDMVDRRDPKLALAPIEAERDLTFTTPPPDEDLA